MPTVQLIAPESTTAARTEARGHHFANLSAVLGDGAEWHFTGDVMEDPNTSGKCSCGHTGLRYLFKIERDRDGRTAVVGSRCIEHFHECNPSMVAAIVAKADELRTAASDRIRQAKALLAESALQAAIAHASELAYRLDSLLAVETATYNYRDYNLQPAIGYRSTRRVSRDIWSFWHTSDVAAGRIAARTDAPYPFRFKAYKSRSAFMKTVEATTGMIERLLAGPIWER